MARTNEKKYSVREYGSLEKAIGRKVPHNNDAEKRMLCSFMLDGEKRLVLMAAMAKGLSPEWFYSSAHQLIFDAMLDLNRRDMHIEILTMVEVLESRDTLERAGGLPYLAEIQACIETDVYFWSYFGIVLGKYKARSGILLATGLLEKLYGDSTVEFGDVASDILSISGEIADLCLSHDDVTLKDRAVSVHGRNQDWWDGKTISYARDISWTVKELDDSFEPVRPDDEDRIVTLLGKGGSGKTAITRQIAWKQLCEGRNVTVFTYEVSGEMYLRTMAANVARIDLREDPETQKLNEAGGKLGDKRFAEMQKCLEFLGSIADESLHLYDTNPDIDFITSTCRALKKKLGRLDMVIVDYLQLLKFSRITANRRGDEVIDAIMAELRSMSAECGCSVWLMSGVNNEGEAKGSQGVFQASDRYIIMTRTEKDDQGHDQSDPNRRSVRIQMDQRKNKYGKIGKCWVSFQRPYMRFWGLPPDGFKGRKSHGGESGNARDF